MTSEFVKADGLLIPRRLWEQAKHEERMGYALRSTGVGVALNREMRRRAAKEARKRQKQYKPGDPVVVSPVLVPKQVSQAEAVDQVSTWLSEQIAQFTHPGTIGTLKGALDYTEGKLVEKLWREGRPIPREIIRQAIANIYARGQAKRGSK